MYLHLTDNKIPKQPSGSHICGFPKLAYFYWDSPPVPEIGSGVRKDVTGSLPVSRQRWVDEWRTAECRQMLQPTRLCFLDAYSATDSRGSSW